MLLTFKYILFLKTKLYYVNYCTDQNFEDVKRAGVIVKDAIVLCRYGEIFRGNMVIK